MTNENCRKIYTDCFTADQIILLSTNSSTNDKRVNRTEKFRRKAGPVVEDFLSARMLSQLREFGLGATAACGACFFTNPLEVVKTRMQLQGELKARGTYAVHYKNAFHAFYTIGRFDGLRSLQSGLAPALVYQAVMNGCRLGSYQVFTNLKLTANSEGRIEFWRCLLAGAVSGAIGAFLGSPAYMVSTETSKVSCMWAFGSRVYRFIYFQQQIPNFDKRLQNLVTRLLRDCTS